jgi:hypothetical protein
MMRRRLTYLLGQTRIVTASHRYPQGEPLLKQRGRTLI